MNSPEVEKKQPPTSGPKTNMGTVKSVASASGGAMGNSKR
jgi:hypothetical protein